MVIVRIKVVVVRFCEVGREVSASFVFSCFDPSSLGSTLRYLQECANSPKRQLCEALLQRKKSHIRGDHYFHRILMYSSLSSLSNALFEFSEFYAPEQNLGCVASRNVWLQVNLDHLGNPRVGINYSMHPR